MLTLTTRPVLLLHNDTASSNWAADQEQEGEGEEEVEEGEGEKKNRREATLLGLTFLMVQAAAVVQAQPDGVIDTNSQGIHRQLPRVCPQWGRATDLRLGQ